MTGLGWERVLPIFTVKERSERKLRRRVSRGSVMPQATNLWINGMWGTLSKAFSKSMNTAWEIMPSSYAFVRLSMTVSMLVMQDLPGRKPCWVGERMPFEWRCAKMASFKIPSKILLGMLVREMGR